MSSDVVVCSARGLGVRATVEPAHDERQAPALGQAGDLGDDRALGDRVGAGLTPPRRRGGRRRHRPPMRALRDGVVSRRDL
jgi:hypothetical protein